MGEQMTSAPPSKRIRHFLVTRGEGERLTGRLMTYVHGLRAIRQIQTLKQVPIR